MEFVTKYNFHEKAAPYGEINNEVSLTVPDQSYTVREMLESFTRNIPLPLKENGHYQGIAEFDEILPSISDFDLSDIEAARLQVAEIQEALSAQSEKLKQVKPNETTDSTNI